MSSLPSDSWTIANYYKQDMDVTPICLAFASSAKRRQYRKEVSAKAQR
jgi:hypothetical protein